MLIRECEKRAPAMHEASRQYKIHMCPKVSVWQVVRLDNGKKKRIRVGRY